MTSPFSWSDTVQIAFSSCLPCLKRAPSPADEASQDREPPNYNPAINWIPRARPDELQGLLNDHDTDPEAETVSLHSNPGQGRRNRKKKRTKKASSQPRRITLFGYDLFGRPAPPPIRLPEDDEALYSSRPPTIATAHSTTSTLDSDAAPLDSSIIATLSSTNAAAAFVDESAAIEAERLREKAERRQQRREKKELKRVAQMLAERGVVGDGEEFEGFQGSGHAAGTYPQPSDATTTSRLGSDSGSGSAGFGSRGQKEEYGQFVAAPPLQQQQQQPEEDDDAADLDGGLYSSQSKRRPGGSDSRSRTSASTSDRAPRNIIYHLQAQPQPSLPEPKPKPKPKKPKSKSTSASGSSRTTKSHSSTTTSQSPSLASPTSPHFPVHAVSPSTVEQGQGFFDLEDEPASAPPNPHVVEEAKQQRGVPSTGLTRPGFPMTGFGGGGPGGGIGAKRSRDLAAFLARSGEGDRADGL